MTRWASIVAPCAIAVAALWTIAGCGARSGLDAQGDAAAPADAGPKDAGPPDSCVPSPEVCGGGDDDCDGLVDEGLGFGPLGEPMVVADPRVELGPFNEALVSTSAGLLAVWRVSFDGSDPMPNVWVRRLDDAGEPVEEPRHLLERPVGNGPRFSPSSGGRHAFVYCGRYGADDATTAWRVDARGETVGEEVRRREGSDDSCGAGEPAVLWSGERHFVAWTDNRYDPRGPETQLDIAGEGLASREVRVLGEGDIAAMPRLARGGGQVLLVWGVRPEPRRSELRMLRFEPDGTQRGERIEVGQPPAYPGEDRADWSTPAVLPRPGGGFLILAANRFGGGLLRMTVDARGEVAAGPAYVDGVPEVSTDSLVAVPRPGGGVYAAIGAEGGLRVLRLEDDGRLIDATPVGEEPAPGYRAWPALAVGGDRLFVSWSEALEEERVQVRIRPFGCVP